MAEKENDKSLVGFLESIFKERKLKNPRYSKGAFARDMRMSPGRLSEILSGKRNLTLKAAQSICSSLKLNKTLSESLFNLVEKQKNLKSKKIIKRLSLSSDDFSEIANWRYYTLLCLIENSDPDDDIVYFSKKLGVEVVQCKKMLDKLDELSLIKKIGSRYQIIASSTTTSQDTLSMAIRKFHQDLLSQHLKLLSSIDLEKREVQSLILNIKTENLKKAKKQIRHFVDKFQEKSAAKDKSDVYALTILLNPLTTS